MTNEIIEQIRNSFDICEIIGETVTLKKVSRGYVGICPFHDEKTGSFHVYQDTQSFYCFGCHKAGNIFTFVMEAENLTFP
ncbi:MAG: DNA primase, partial [Synergistaceae bacterium]|nr:DNA primase [Synergistaceae bacterium]